MPPGREIQSAAELSLRLSEISRREGGKMFLGKPDRWYATPTWRCSGDHVSRTFLKSEKLGCGLCLKCGAPVFLTFPEDADGPLPRSG